MHVQQPKRLFPQLGPPYERLWELLSACHGEREASRVMAKLLAVVVQHGEEELTALLRQVLQEEPVRAGEPSERPQVVVPEALSHYHIEAPSAASYDHLLVGAGHE